MDKAVDQHDLTMAEREYVEPKREIFNVFDINKWHKSKVGDLL